MSLEKFPIIGQSNGVTSQSESLKRKTSPELKKLADKISAPAFEVIANLEELKNDETLTPDEMDIELFQIGKQIVQLSGRGQKKALESYEDVVSRLAFPIIGELYERN